MAEPAASYKRHGEHQMIDYAQRMRQRAEGAEATLQAIREWAERRRHPIAGRCGGPYRQAQDEVADILDGQGAGS